MIERHGGDFDGLIGFVGAESIGDVPMRDFLTHVNTSHPDLSLADFVAALSGELSTEWQRHLLDLCLWVFVAGYEEGEARFWWSCNGELSPNGRYVDIGPCFRAVDDLDKHAIPCYQREHAYATREEVLANVNLFFRNGALVPAAPILDRYTAMIGDIPRRLPRLPANQHTQRLRLPRPDATGVREATVRSEQGHLSRHSPADRR